LCPWPTVVVAAISAVLDTTPNSFCIRVFVLPYKYRMWIVVYVCIYPGGCVFIYIYVYVYAYISVYLQMCYLVIRFLFTIIIYIYLLLCYAQLRPPGYSSFQLHTHSRMAFGLFRLPKCTVFCLTQISEMFSFLGSCRFESWTFDVWHAECNCVLRAHTHSHTHTSC